MSKPQKFSPEFKAKRAVRVRRGREPGVRARSCRTKASLWAGISMVMVEGLEHPCSVGRSLTQPRQHTRKVSYPGSSSDRAERGVRLTD